MPEAKRQKQKSKSKIKMGMTKKPVKYAVIDAFTDSEFKGNPAAVCILEEEEDKSNDDEWLQSLAAEFNLSETCFLLPLSYSPLPTFQLRWFTPVNEVNLCGHATLAAAQYCFTSGVVNTDTVEFSTLSGILTARKVFEIENSASSESGNEEVEQRPFVIELDFPAIPSSECSLGETSSVYKVFSNLTVMDLKKTTSDDLLVVLPSAKAVSELCLDIEDIRKFPGRGLIVTGVAPPDSGFDFFSRFFCPKNGIDEDPVCGSAHCALAHYWSKKMGKSDFIAFAASARTGIVKLHLDEQNNRVKLQGKAITVMEGSVLV